MTRLSALLLATSFCCGQAVPVNPTAPQSVPPSTRPAPTGSTVFVHDTGNQTTNGTNLQNAYNSATCGQDIVLDDGITYLNAFVFNKHCSAPNWILIEGTGCNAGTAPVPTYVSTASANFSSVPPFAPPALTHYAKLLSTNGNPVINTTDLSFNPGAYNYFGCLEATFSTSGPSYVIGTTNFNLETLSSQMGDHFIFDRLYVHGLHANATVQTGRGFFLDGSNISVVNSYVSEIYNSGDSQAILMSYGPGPILIQNNFLSAPTETIMAGGTGKTPGYSCTVAASPSPTTTTATVNTCIDAASGSVTTPPIGTEVMFYTSASAPVYSPANWTKITGNTAGALTFIAIPNAPIAGAAKVKWGILPRDITITKNYLYKLPSWNPSDPSYDGIARSSKDFIESKYGQRWNISANIMVNSWNNGQSYAFNFNSTDQDGFCPWCISSDISMTNNIIKNIAGDLTIIPSQNGGSSNVCPGPLARVLIGNNLFFTVGAAPFIAGASTMVFSSFVACTFTGTQGADSVQLIHNTMLGGGNNFNLGGGIPYNYTNLLIRDNLTEFDQYRWTNQCPDGTPANQDGNACMLGDVSTSGTYTGLNNAIINSGAINGDQGVSDSTLTTRYGSMVLHTYYDTSIATNYAGAPLLGYSTVNTDYHGFFLTGGPWTNAASDGTNPGVNFTTLDAALGATSPTVTCSPKTHVSPPTATDIQLQTNMALSIVPCTNSLTGSGCTVVDVQRVVNAALGGACVVGP